MRVALGRRRDHAQAAELLQAFGERPVARCRQAVAEPHREALTGELDAVDAGLRRGAVDGPGLGLHRAQQRARVGRAQQARCLGYFAGVGGRGRHHDGLPVRALGLVQKIERGGLALLPEARRRPAIVHHQHQRTLARNFAAGIQQRPGERQDHQGRDGQAQ